MKTPNIFLHYWNAEDTPLSFQEILQWEVDPSIIQKIQDDLLSQFTEAHIQQILPNFTWESPRFLEKWDSISQSLILHVQLPEQIWADWIQQLGGNRATQEIPAAPLEEVYPSFEELLTAEIYYARPSDSLQEIGDDMDQPSDSLENIDAEIDDMHPSDLIVSNKEKEPESNSNSQEADLLTFEVESGPMNDSIPETAKAIRQEPTPADEPVEQKAESAEEKTTEPPIATNTAMPILEVKNIMEMYAESPEERVFESIKTEDPSLKDRIHTNMTSSLAETLPLFQKINYIQHLFDGQAEHLDHIIRYIDHEYAQEDWKAYLNDRFAAYQRAENAEIWQELFNTIERKFS